MSFYNSETYTHTSVWAREQTTNPLNGRWMTLPPQFLERQTQTNLHTLALWNRNVLNSMQHGMRHMYGWGNIFRKKTSNTVYLNLES